MHYPLTLTFKTIALAPQISVADADGNLIFYVKQKLFKLKEAVNVFSDKEQTRLLFTIKADRVIDFSAQYHFRDAAETDLGSVKKRGMKSLWKAHYDIFDGATNQGGWGRKTGGRIDGRNLKQHHGSRHLLGLCVPPCLSGFAPRQRRHAHSKAGGVF